MKKELNDNEITDRLNERKLNELKLILLVDDFCAESLTPIDFENWETIKRALLKNRHLPMTIDELN